jgi:histidyl-tRNA synthetase
VEKQFQSIKGTFDILPQDPGRDTVGSESWYFLEEHVRHIASLYGFREIRTPVIEHAALVSRSIGAYTDIVSKEMFSIHRGDDHYVLRPELTASVVRAYLQHHLGQTGGVSRVFYMGPCFRAERPQKGRFRQFHQFGGEILGTAEPSADVEIISLAMDVYSTLGISDIELRINSLGNPASRKAYVQALRAYLEPHKEMLSATSLDRLRTNPLRILDTKNAKEQELVRSAPLLSAFLSPEDKDHYASVKASLESRGYTLHEDPYLVRGLDYYTRTAFEIESPQLGAQSALAGGGRYDLLAEEIGSPSEVPAVGFAAGFERLLLVLEAEKRLPVVGEALDVFMVTLGESARRVSGRILASLRQHGVRVMGDLSGRSIKAQMREANRINARWAIILGDGELDTGRAIVKDLASGEQQEVPFDELALYMKQQKVARNRPI